LGVDRVIDSEPKAVLAETRQRPPEIVIETVGGNAPTLDLALRAVRAGGRIVTLGKFTVPISLPPLRFLMKEVRVVSSMTYSRTGPRPDFVTALDLLERERARLMTLVTHRVPLDEIARGFALAADKRGAGAIKVAVDVGR
jgi:threonine dehydrogenase-like Zn-dependent dehydrogenase